VARSNPGKRHPRSCCEAGCIPESDEGGGDTSGAKKIELRVMREEETQVGQKRSKLAAYLRVMREETNGTKRSKEAFRSDCPFQATECTARHELCAYLISICVYDTVVHNRTNPHAHTYTHTCKVQYVV
jgi:hypothetical protein